MKKTLLAAAIATLATLPIAVTSAEAQNHRERDRYERNNYERNDRHNSYDRQGRYRQPRNISRNDNVWRGRDGRYYCKRDNGTTGLIVGAAAGALLGRTVDGGQNRTLGTILGAAGGGLLGREIDRGGVKCR
jgi:uncharacterized protein YcfJ